MPLEPSLYFVLGSKFCYKCIYELFKMALLSQNCATRWSDLLFIPSLNKYIIGIFSLDKKENQPAMISKVYGLVG